MLADQSQQWCPTSAQVTVLQARGLRTKGKNGTNDAYAIMQVAKDKFSTSVAEKSVAPMWKEEASFDLPTSTAADQQQQQRGSSSSTLQVHIMHRALVGPDKLLGQAVINLRELSEDKTRNKTEWYKLLNKAGKPDKDRGEVLLDIQFMRNNMTASMFDLSSVGDKPRSRLGKLKDKVRGKKKDGQLSETASAVVPSSFTQVLTDSEDEDGGGGGVRDGEGEGGDKDKKKKHKLKSLFSPKSNLHKNMSQSMSVLGPLPERSSSLSGSRSSGLNIEPSEGKKKFKFMTHKRSGSSDSKISQGSLSLSGRTKDPQSNLCINGSHVYNEEPQPRRSRGGSTFSLASSGLGSMEDLPRGAESSNPSLASADSFRALKQQQQPPWSEGDSGSRAVDEEEEQEAGSGGTEVEGEKRRVSQMETAETIEEQSEESRLEEERIEEEKRRMEAEEELERRRLRMEEERKARQEARAREERERKQREEEEKRAREERERIAEERRRIEEEEERKRREEEEEEERERIAEERRRIEEEEERKRREEEEEEERERMAEERRRIEEEEKMRLGEEKRRAREEEEERERIAEERRRIEEEERIREEEEERERIAEERRRMEEEEEEAMRMVEERKRREEEKKRIREGEERERIAEERRRIEEEEEEERIRQAEVERLKMEEERRKMREEEEENRVREERERKAAEERKRIEEEEERIRRKAEMERLEAEERKRREEQEEERERERLAEERRRQEEEERRRREEEEEEEERFREEEEAMEREAAAERRREEEERLRKEEELRLRRVEEEERAGRMRIEVEEEEDDGWEPEKEISRVVKEVVMVKEEERQREEDMIRRDADMKTLDNEEEETTTSTEEKEISGETLANGKEQSQWFEGRQEASKASRDQRSSEHLAAEEDHAPSAERLASADPFDDDEEDISSSSNPFEEEASSMAAAAARTHRGAAIETAKVSAVKPSPPQRFAPSNPFLNPFESETEPSQQMDVCVLEKKRRAPLPPNNKRQTFPPESAVNSTINLAESRPSGLQSTSRATPLAGNDMEDSIGADGTKDFVRDKGPAPQPPGKNDPRKERSSETTSATKIKNSNSFPQRLVQIIAPVSRPASTTSEVLEGTSVATHNKGPAPRRPQCSSETKGVPPSSAADAYPKASGESNQHSPVTDRVPVVVGSNPFEEEEDEEEDKAVIPLTRPDEITNSSNPEKRDSSSSRYRSSSAVDHQDTTGNAKKKSSKTEHAPLPPARKTAVLSDRLGVNSGAESASSRHDGVVPDKRVVLPCVALSSSSHPKPLETPDTKGDDLSQMVPSGQITAVSHPPAQTSQTQVVVAKGIGEQAGGRWDVPASASRRPHPVKPLSPQEQQPASTRQETRDKTTAVLCEVEDKIKKEKQEDQPRPTGPYSQLTQEELICLVAKQQSQLSERDGKISQLEKYIDALLVRVMEEKPSILMSLSSSSTV